MDKDRIKGSAEQAKGKVKEWAGKITGDSKTEAEGKADQVPEHDRRTERHGAWRVTANFQISILESPERGSSF